MTNRKAFTMVEILVVIGIIALLAATLLPIINSARRHAEVTAQGLDFQTITTALENYHTDFGDYPRNIVLPKWNSYAGPTKHAEPPIFYTLASALLGLNPAISQAEPASAPICVVSGDGADGPGFRARVISIVGTGGIVAGTTTMTINIQKPFHFIQGLSSIDLSVGSPLPLPTLDTSTEEVIGILSIAGMPTSGTATDGIYGIAGATTALSLTLTTTPAFKHNPGDAYILKTATGKIWAAYLPADKIKMAYIDPATGVAPVAAVPPVLAQPVFVDRWGQPIQYFTLFGPNTNRTSNSTDFPGNDPSVVAGPLYGVSAPASVDLTTPKSIGENAIWDWHDGIPVSVFANQGVTWKPSASSGVPDLSMAFKWMLGDEPNVGSTPAQDNVIRASAPGHASETLRYSGPFILISAGPYSTWCDLSGTPATSEAYSKDFTNSGNIYNFDR